MTQSHKIASPVHGFHVLPLTFPALPSLPTTATHYLYIARHEPKIPTEATPRSLFIVNVPIDATEAHMRHLLSLQLGLPQGRIEEVSFEKQRIHQTVGRSGPEGGDGGTQSRKRKRSTSQRPVRVLEESRLPSTWDRELQVNGGSAIVTFVDKVSMDAALKAVARAIKSTTTIVWGEGLNIDLPQLGSARYLNHAKLQHPDKAALLQSVNAYMTAYAAQEATQAKLQARQRSQPDDDGFVTVTKGGRVDPVRQEAAQAIATKHKAKQVGLEDFYRFQTREKKKARASELVRQFEEDKEEIRRMKERRGSFRPE